MKVSLCQALTRSLSDLKLSHFPSKKGWFFYEFYKEISAAATDFEGFQKKWLEDNDVTVGERGELPEDKVPAFNEAMSGFYNKEVEIHSKPFLTPEEWVETAEKSGLSMGLISMLDGYLVEYPPVKEESHVEKG